MDTEQLLVLVPGLLSAAAIVAGARSQRPLRDPAVWASIVVATILMTAWLVSESTGSDDDVSVLRYAEGLGLFAAGIALPLAVFYFAGLKLATKPLILAAGWLATLYPLYVYMVLVLLFGADLAFCAPDAYECPV